VFDGPFSAKLCQKCSEYESIPALFSLLDKKIPRQTLGHYLSICSKCPQFTAGIFIQAYFWLLFSSVLAKIKFIEW